MLFLGIGTQSYSMLMIKSVLLSLYKNKLWVYIFEILFEGACEMFGLAPRESNGRLWRGDVTLRQPLDAEVQNVFNIPIRWVYTAWRYDYK